MASLDEKIVKMSFDNKKFEKEVENTIGSISKLKKSLEFADASKGFNEIEKSASRIDLSPIQAAAQKVSDSFTVMGRLCNNTINSIVSSIQGAGNKLYSFYNEMEAFSPANIAGAWGKYNSKTSYVQTIMNATGFDIDEVNAYLDKLTWFSDETSYSFSDMTMALGSMLSSGASIEKVIPMLEGMANATAYAGKGAAEFQRVIYNLNQSYSQGFLSLQDWKSVQMAGADSKALKESIIRAAEKLNKVAEGAITTGNFTETLKDKWADTEVLEAAFGEWAKMTEEAYALVEEGQFNTASEAYDHLTQIYLDNGGKLNDIYVAGARAAQEAKSFSEAIGSVTEAVQTKVMALFEIVFGNYMQSKELWTNVANDLWEIFAGPFESDGFDGLARFNDYITKSGKNAADVNKKLLDYGKSIGAIEDGIKSLSDADDLSFITKDVLKSLGIELEHVGSKVTTVQKDWKDLFDTSKMNASQLYWYKALITGEYGSSVGRKDPVKNLAELKELPDWMLNCLGLSRETVDGFKELEETVEETVETIDGILEGISEKGSMGIIDIFKAVFGTEEGHEKVVDSIMNLVEGVGKARALVGAALSGFFPQSDAERIGALNSVLDKFNRFTKIFTSEIAEETVEFISEVSNFASDVSKVVTRFSSLRLISPIVENAVNAFKIFSRIIPAPLKKFRESLESLSLASRIDDAFKKLTIRFERYSVVLSKLSSSFLAAGLDYLSERIPNVSKWLDKLTTKVDQFSNNIFTGTKGIRDFVEALYANTKKNGYKGFIDTFADAYSNLVNEFKSNDSVQYAINKLHEIQSAVSKFLSDLKLVKEAFSESFSKGLKTISDIYPVLSPAIGVIEKIANKIGNFNNSLRALNPILKMTYALDRLLGTHLYDDAINIFLDKHPIIKALDSVYSQLLVRVKASINAFKNFALILPKPAKELFNAVKGLKLLDRYLQYNEKKTNRFADNLNLMSKGVSSLMAAGLDFAAKKITKYTAKINELFDSFLKSNSNGSRYMREFSQMIEDMYAKTMVNGYEGFVDAIANSELVRHLKTQFAPVFKFFDSVGDAIGSMTQYVRVAFEAYSIGGLDTLEQFIRVTNEPLYKSIKQIQSLFKSLKTTIGDMLSSIKKGFSEDGLKGAVTGFLSSLKKIVGNGVGSVAGGIFSNILSSIEKVLLNAIRIGSEEGIDGLIDALCDRLIDGWTELSDFIKSEGFTGVLNKILDGFDYVFNEENAEKITGYIETLRKEFPALDLVFHILERFESNIPIFATISNAFKEFKTSLDGFNLFDALGIQGTGVTTTGVRGVADTIGYFADSVGKISFGALAGAKKFDFGGFIKRILTGIGEGIKFILSIGGVSAALLIALELFQVIGTIRSIAMIGTAVNNASKALKTTALTNLIRTIVVCAIQIIANLDHLNSFVQKVGSFKAIIAAILVLGSIAGLFVLVSHVIKNFGKNGSLKDLQEGLFNLLSSIGISAVILSVAKGIETIVNSIVKLSEAADKGKSFGLAASIIGEFFVGFGIMIGGVAAAVIYASTMGVSLAPALLAASVFIFAIAQGLKTIVNLLTKTKMPDALTLIDNAAMLITVLTFIAVFTVGMMVVAKMFGGAGTELGGIGVYLLAVIAGLWVIMHILSTYKFEGSFLQILGTLAIIGVVLAAIAAFSFVMIKQIGKIENVPKGSKGTLLSLAAVLIGACAALYLIVGTMTSLMSYFEKHPFKWGTFLPAIGVIAVAVLAVMGVFYSIEKVLSASSGAKLMPLLGIIMLFSVISMALISLKLLNVGWGDMIGYFGGMALCLWVLSNSLSKLEYVDSDKIKGFAGNIKAIAFALIAAGIAVKLFSSAVKTLSKLGNFWETLGYALILIGGLCGVIALLGYTANKCKDSMKPFAAGLLIAAIAVGIIAAIIVIAVYAIAKLANKLESSGTTITVFGHDLGGVGTVLVMLAAVALGLILVVAALGAIAYFAGDKMKAFGTGVLTTSIGVLIMAVAIAGLIAVFAYLGDKMSETGNTFSIFGRQFEGVNAIMMMALMFVLGLSVVIGVIAVAAKNAGPEMVAFGLGMLEVAAAALIIVGCVMAIIFVIAALSGAFDGMEGGVFDVINGISDGWSNFVNWFSETGVGRMVKAIDGFIGLLASGLENIVGLAEKIGGWICDIFDDLFGGEDKAREGMELIGKTASGHNVYRDKKGKEVTFSDEYESNPEDVQTDAEYFREHGTLVAEAIDDSTNTISEAIEESSEAVNDATANFAVEPIEPFHIGPVVDKDSAESAKEDARATIEDLADTVNGLIGHNVIGADGSVDAKAAVNELSESIKEEYTPPDFNAIGDEVGTEDGEALSVNFLDSLTAAIIGGCEGFNFGEILMGAIGLGEGSTFNLSESLMQGLGLSKEGGIDFISNIKDSLGLGEGASFDIFSEIKNAIGMNGGSESASELATVAENSGSNTGNGFLNGIMNALGITSGSEDLPLMTEVTEGISGAGSVSGAEFAHTLLGSVGALLSPESGEATANDYANALTKGLSSATNLFGARNAGDQLGQSATEGLDNGADGNTQGKTFAQEFMDGMSSMIDLVKTKAYNLGLAAGNRLRDGFRDGQNGLATHAMDPIVDSIDIGLDLYSNNVTYHVRRVAEDSAAIIVDAFSAVPDAVDRSIVSTQRLTPVLDMDTAVARTNQLSNIISRINAQRAQASFAAPAVETNSQNGGSGQVVNYTQNNYSPKALSRIEIYRQTRNQLHALPYYGG